MNEQVLSKRLAKIGEYVPQNARLADIGSDHAYLPVALMLQNQIAYAVAGEVVKGPFESAQKQVRKNGLSDKVVVRLADGLSAIEASDEITVIVIAGMGGALIRSILEAGQKNQRLNGNEQLILQPNVGEKNLREWLMMNDYQIVAEEILEENKKVYEIIIAQPNQPTMYTAQQLLFGPFLIQEKSEIFKQKWTYELKNLERVLNEMQKAQNVPAAKIAEINQQMEWIKEVLV